jgi:hypothetical protein
MWVTDQEINEVNERNEIKTRMQINIVKEMGKSRAGTSCRKWEI